MRPENKILKRFSMFFTALILFGMLSTVAFGVVSQVPLFLTNNVQPNVMILLDNSGSMDTIMAHPAYDPATVYTGTFISTTYYTLSKQGNYIYNGKTIWLPRPYAATRYDGNYLNWLFWTAAPTQYNSLSTDASLQKTRIQTARTVISNLVKNVSGVRFGLAKLNTTWDSSWTLITPMGGSIVQGCGSLTSTNVDAVVNAINAETWTPLGEALAEVWQYFKGAATSYPEYNGATTYTSPITQSCQKNFTIIVTDGEPTYDGCYRGDFSTYGCSNNENDASHLADVAAYMHTNDAASTLTGAQTVETYAIGLTFNSALLQQTATNGGGQYYTTTSGIDLNTAMQNAVNDILGRISAASSVAVNNAFLTSNTMMYRSKFESGSWRGFLEAYSINQTNGQIGNLVWEASANTPNALSGAGGLNGRTADSRTIYTAGLSGSNYVRYDYTTANAPTFAGSGFMNFSSASASNLVNYVRGADVSGYRTRSSKLGDMVYSQPVIVGPPQGIYTDHNYAGFKASQAGRKSMIYVGGNDGMMHAFDAQTGNEDWAFIPNSLLPNLKYLRNTPYNHQSFVDGAATIVDANIYYKTSATATSLTTTKDWRSVMVCGLRGGGQSYFAMDVTDPANPAPLWELNASGSNCLGYTFGAPLIVKLRTGPGTEDYVWAAVLANGYQSSSPLGSASLLIVDLATGSILKEIIVDSNTNLGAYVNGLSSPSAVDLDGDGYVNYIYAGDLRGHLWKFDVSGNGSATWDVSYRKNGAPQTPIALFRATDPIGGMQPITVAPEIMLRGDHEIVFFGTGKYFEDSDKTNTQRQGFYGIFDFNVVDNNPSSTAISNEAMLTRSDLVAQTLTEVTVTVSGTNYKYRYASDNPITTQKGWYVDLPATYPGERIITDPVAKSGKIIFTTFIPSSAPCAYGGSSWLMELNPDTGGTVVKPVFDVNMDGSVTASDTVTAGGVQKLPTGTYLGDGIASSPTILGSNKDGLEYKYITKTTGEVSVVLEGGGSNQLGVRSWRQLF